MIYSLAYTLNYETLVFAILTLTQKQIITLQLITSQFSLAPLKFSKLIQLIGSDKQLIIVNGLQLRGAVFL